MRAAHEREQVIANMRKHRREIEEVFTAAENWNAANPDQEPIDPDPSGVLRRIADGLDRVLANDPGHGPIASFLPADFVFPKQGKPS